MLSSSNLSHTREFALANKQNPTRFVFSFTSPSLFWEMIPLNNH